MWYNKFNWTILSFLVLFTLVTGSCLEYGHSCWGAHGKRSGNRAANVVKPATPYADNFADQLLNNNNGNNNVNFIDDDSNNSNNNNNNNNKLNDLPLTASALSPLREREREEGNAMLSRDVNDEGKWRQLLRQHRYQLRQLQRQFDATDAEQQRQQQQQQQQQQQLPIGDFFELKK